MGFRMLPGWQAAVVSAVGSCVAAVKQQAKSIEAEGGLSSCPVTASAAPPLITHTHTGAQGIGLLATSLMGNTLEDILTLAVAGMASYVAVLNLPLKRSEIKGKVGRVANNFVEGVTAAMAEVGRGVVRWGGSRGGRGRGV